MEDCPLRNFRKQI
jgi:hypothetical protein